MPVIDFHNHYYPPAYLHALGSKPTHVKVGVDAHGNPLLHYPGDYNIVVPGHRDIDYRERVLAEHGVDMQVLTLTTPGTHVEDPGLAAELSTLVNDAFAEVVATRHRFAALATLPLNDPRGSARELERAAEHLVQGGDARDAAAAERAGWEGSCKGRTVVAERAGDVLLREAGQGAARFGRCRRVQGSRAHQHQ